MSGGDGVLCKKKIIKYCEFIIIRGIPIFVDFVGTGKPRI